MRMLAQVLEISFALLQAYSRHKGVVKAQTVSRYLEFLHQA
jgi:hypothetical protein